MKRLLLVVVLFFLVGCATKHYVIMKDKEEMATIEVRMRTLYKNMGRIYVHVLQLEARVSELEAERMDRMNEEEIKYERERRENIFSTNRGWMMLYQTGKINKKEFESLIKRSNVLTDILTDMKEMKNK